MKDGMTNDFCPRRLEDGRAREGSDTWRENGTCSYCGSLHPDVLMAAIEAGEVTLGPTDKSYKIYVSPKEGVELTPPRAHLLPKHAKFYFQHLSKEQQDRFIAVHNEKRMSIDYPGHFYVTPFFAHRVEHN
jgi:hypothetical protein